MNKELKIIPPKGYEIDKENSTFECIKFKKKPLTYEDIAKELFFHKENLSIDNVDIYHTPDTICYQDKLIAKSSKQLEKLLAINKLMNVAKYLNGNWKPNWNDCKEKWSIYINADNSIKVTYVYGTHDISVYFKTEGLTRQAIDILGENTIRLALSADW